MSAPQWMPYAGLVTGALGALTGVAGTIMGWIAYRRSNQMKSLDLRLELRKAINQLTRDVRTLNELLPKVKRSREAIFAARGAFHSGGMKVWKEQYAKDSSEVGHLTLRASRTIDLDALVPEQLEATAAEVHKMQTEVTAMVDKFKAGMAEDENSPNALAT